MDKIPFSPKELEVIGDRPFYGKMRIPVLNTPITPRENYLMLLRGEEPLWMPGIGDWASLTPAIVRDNIARGFVHEAGDRDPNVYGGGEDMFGVEWEWVPEAGGSMVRPGKQKVEDICCWEDYITFPDIDSWDWEASAANNMETIKAKDRLFGITILNGIFERLVSFVGMEDALMALVDEDEQEAVHRLFDKLADFYPRLIKKFKDYYDIDYITFHDDWGSQRAPFFSLDTVREMILPCLKRIVDATHEMGLYFELHSCGKNELLVPAMIEAGVDMWNGQPMNDKKMLVEKYGDKMIFGVDPVNIPENIDKDGLYEKVGEFVNTYNGYRVVGGFGARVPGYREALYELSRVAKCGRAE